MEMGGLTAEHSTPNVAVENIFVRNMRALWRVDAHLALQIEAVHPLDVPAFETAKDGAATVKLVGPGGSPLYLHSKYRPVQEAESWASTVKCEDRYVVALSGFGLGHHVKALFGRMPPDAILTVAEPNIPLLRVAMEAVDVSEMLASGRVFIFTSLDRGALVERLEPRSILLTAGAGTLFAAHPASLQAQPEFHSAFQKMITEFVAFTRIGFVTLMLNNVTTCRNVANNLGRYAATPPIDVLHNAYAGLPAILVAAGPSLQKNMHLLHEVKGDKNGKGRRAVIIAVQTMLKPMLAAGIEPDFVTSLDYNTVSTRFFENLEESGSTGRVHLVAEPKANWNVLDVFAHNRGTMSLCNNDFAERLLRGVCPPRMSIKAGATVAHLSFYLAEFLGCSPIILTGQDLGFVDGLYYKPGTAIHETWGVELGRFNTLETKEWERIVRSRQILRKIPDIHGAPMYTEEQFFVYLQQFERDFAASRVKVIDATEGGAKKQHVTVMTLRNAIDQYAPQNGPSLDGRAMGWKQWAVDEVGQLEKTRHALKLRHQSAVDMQETCAETLPLLEQMIEHQKDENRMRELFVAVDRLRTRVGSDPITFEMVCNLNTIGELRRFQADLGVKTVEKDSMEHQRRQLARDIDYVSNLRVGAERLQEVLDEALGRLDRQIETRQAGELWPVEIAGGN